MSAQDTYRERLASQIESAGLSQSEVARRAGTYHPNVSRVLSGEQDATITFAGRLAAAAGVELWELLAPADVVERERKRRKRAGG